MGKEKRMLCLMKIINGDLKGWVVSEGIDNVIERMKNSLISGKPESLDKDELNQAMLELVKLKNTPQLLDQHGKHQLTQHYFLLVDRTWE